MPEGRRLTHAGAGVLSTVQQIDNASGVAVIGAAYFGLGHAVMPRAAMAHSLALLAAAFSILAALLHEHAAPHVQE